MESTRHKSLYVSTLCGPERDRWINPELAGFLISLTQPQAQERFRVSFGFTEADPYDRALNLAVARFLDSDAEWFLTFDNDAAPLPNFADFISAAMRDGKLFAVPRFHGIRLPGADPLSPILTWNPLSNPVRSRDVDANGWLELNECGGHTMLIHRRVFENVSKPYFQTRLAPDGDLELSADFAFCEKVRAAGFRIFGNVNFTVGHLKTINITTAIAARLGAADLNRNAY